MPNRIKMLIENKGMQTKHKTLLAVVRNLTSCSNNVFSHSLQKAQTSLIIWPLSIHIKLINKISIL